MKEFKIWARGRFVTKRAAVLVIVLALSFALISGMAVFGATYNQTKPIKISELIDIPFLGNTNYYSLDKPKSYKSSKGFKSTIEKTANKYSATKYNEFLSYMKFQTPTFTVSKTQNAIAVESVGISSVSASDILLCDYGEAIDLRTLLNASCL
jgi:hypothetical protein